MPLRGRASQRYTMGVTAGPRQGREESGVGSSKSPAAWPHRGPSVAGTPEPEPSGSRVAGGPPVPLNVGWLPRSARGPDQVTCSFLSRNARPRHTVCAHCPSAPLLCSPPPASQVSHPLDQGKHCALTPGREALPHRQKPNQIWFWTVL